MCTKNLDTTLIENKLATITTLVEKIKSVNSLKDKLAIVNSQGTVNDFLSKSLALNTLLQDLKPEYEYIVKVLIAIGQGPIFFSKIDLLSHPHESFLDLLNRLSEVETFYRALGGLAGYYHTVIALIDEKEKPQIEKFTNEHYYRPIGIDLSTDQIAQRAAVRWAIENLPLLAHICPIGGAGDRLKLLDENSQEPLPVAFLQVGGFSLLEGIVRDLQGIEFLYWKIFNKQLIVPLALMTSEEKNNDHHIKSLCEKLNYFNRKKESFRQFLQPLVPVITEEGNFALSSSLKLILKPGGHGVLWRLAIENNIFGWFESLGKKKLLVRQINNPVAATDAGIWALVGFGQHQHKAFGFLSCDRLIGAAEGMLAVKETSEADAFQYCLTNIEYTDFAAKGLTDSPKVEGSHYSAFPANTNILFADIAALSEAISSDPVPGMIVNMKSKFLHLDQNGNLKESRGGRLESMMQNIADSFIDKSSAKLNHEIQANLHSYIVYEKREKVISVTKNKFTPKKPINETPEGCFYDQICNAYDLLSNYCKILLPALQTPDNFMMHGPE
nr:UTP--glucose-1-phosphate uridylyltransferase [Parachlamydiaceae bacterium]